MTKNTIASKKGTVEMKIRSYIKFDIFTTLLVARDDQVYRKGCLKSSSQTSSFILRFVHEETS